jgi:hypothetical protein
MIIFDQITEANRIEYLENLLKVTQTTLESVTEQRDRLAGELKEAQDAIEMMLRDSSCRRIPAYTKKQLAAVEGGSDE